MKNAQCTCEGYFREIHPRSERGQRELAGPYDRRASVGAYTAIGRFVFGGHDSTHPAVVSPIFLPAYHSGGVTARSASGKRQIPPVTDSLESGIDLNVPFIRRSTLGYFAPAESEMKLRRPIRMEKRWNKRAAGYSWVLHAQSSIAWLEPAGWSLV